MNFMLCVANIVPKKDTVANLAIDFSFIVSKQTTSAHVTNTFYKYLNMQKTIICRCDVIISRYQKQTVGRQPIKSEIAYVLRNNNMPYLLTSPNFLTPLINWKICCLDPCWNKSYMLSVHTKL
jgi:hypothetical protein